MQRTRLARRWAIAVSLGTLAVAAPAQSEVPSAASLEELAWTCLPEYAHEHRFFLTETEERQTRAASHLLQAALALDPSGVRGWWSLGHAEVLLAENRRNRGEDELARGHYDAAVSALTQALEIAPDDPWSRYARGAIHAAFGAHETALADFARTIEIADSQLAANAGDLSAAQIRFKCMEWRTEVLMRAFRFDEARAEMEPFHTEFSENRFPLLIALSESYLRERDFAGARGAYESILEEFPQDFQAFSLLGYLAGLVEDREQATERLARAIKLESPPGVYTRIWYWLLATDEARPTAEEELAFFLENPPSTLSAWDHGLGLYVLGAGEPESFVPTAQAEVERRMAATEALDNLMCEVWFYVGTRFELDATKVAEGPERRLLQEQAIAAYRKALGFSPEAWKWEWAFARLRFARLAEELGIEFEPGFQVNGNIVSGAIEGTVRGGQWHVPPSDAPRAALEREPRAGDLFMGVAGEGPFRLVVGL